MTDTLPGTGTANWGGALFPPAVVNRIVSVIVGGSPFANSVTRLPTDRGSLAFPVVTDLDEPAWVPELGLIPTLLLDGDPLLVGISKLAGTVLVSNESIADAQFPVTAGTEQVMRDTFSAKLDRDLIAGDGQGATPTGVLASAPATAGADLWAATIAAKADIADRGGRASHIALNATAIGAEEARLDETGRPLHPEGLAAFAGLTVVPARAATVPLVYDAARLYLVVRNDFIATRSVDYAPAFEHDATAIRLIGRFALAAPGPDASIRQLDLSDASAARTAEPAKAAGATKK